MLLALSIEAKKTCVALVLSLKLITPLISTPKPRAAVRLSSAIFTLRATC